MIKIGLFVLLAVLSLVVQYFTFEFQYMWYREASEAIVFRSIFFLFMATVICSWAFYPSRLFVSLVGTVALLFPWVFEQEFQVDLAFLGVLAFSVLLLVAATELRRQLRTKGPFA